MTNKTDGILITFEGIDGSGKSTVLESVAKRLTQLGLPVLVTKEPGGTQLGKHLRGLLHERDFELCSKAEFLLFAADRAQHRREIIEPALAQGKIVLSDRMADSSLAYQGYGRGIDKEMITTVNSWAMNGAVPDLTIYVRVDYATALERIVSRNKALTSFEKEKADFFARVIEGFDIVSRSRPNVVILDGKSPIDEVNQSALAIITPFLCSKGFSHEHQSSCLSHCRS